jgi:tetratricopeptide (TPR) repeat protein
MNGRYWIIPLTIAALYLGGCTATPQRSLIAKWDFVREHEQLARSYESDGSFQHALQEWLIISAVIPDALEPQTEIGRLERVITERVTRYLQAAKAALARSDYAGAQLQLLKVLALQPDNQEAIGKLRKLEARRAYNRLAHAPKVSRKVIRTYKAPTEQPMGKAGEKSNLKQALLHLSNEQYEAALERFILARKLEEASDNVLEEYIINTRNTLAEQHYDKGVIAFRATRYSQAVVEFKMSLKYNLGHQKARLYLETASELQTRMAP